MSLVLSGKTFLVSFILPPRKSWMMKVKVKVKVKELLGKQNKNVGIGFALGLDH